jgi:serpin B
MSTVGKRPAPSSEVVAAGSAAVTAFSTRLLRQSLAVEPGNVICSPFSVAAALGMTVNGARGRTASEMLAVLGGASIDALDEGLAAVASTFESRAGARTKLDGNAAQVNLDVANSLWGQTGTPWEQSFLDALARYYGAAMRMVDYKRDAQAARVAVNAWTSDATHAKIPELVPAGVFDERTRLTLVNAVYLKAPWEEPFERSATTKGTFTTALGVARTVDMMTGSLSHAYAASGPGWRAVTLPYAGRELGMTLVLPDASTQTFAAWLDAGGLGEVLTALRPHPTVQVTVPRWTFRTKLRLKALLSSMGMPTAFTDSADFSAMTTSERLLIDEVLHEGFVAVDEDGTEAAAATAVVIRAVTAVADPVVFVADQPFVYVVHDLATQAPLFVGRVADPT